jgi:RHS repeat-associated protein
VRQAPLLRVTLGDTHSVEMNLRMAGQYANAETGLCYNIHRYYDPQQGRYLTPTRLVWKAASIVMPTPDFRYPPQLILIDRQQKKKLKDEHIIFKMRLASNLPAMREPGAAWKSNCCSMCRAAAS